MVWHTWTLNTPQTGCEVTFFTFAKIPSGSSKLPPTNLIFEGSFCCSFCALPDEVFRVTARISTSASWVRRELITPPPCFPVAPMMRIVLGIVV